MAAILDLMPLFGFRDVIYAKAGQILLMKNSQLYDIFKIDKDNLRNYINQYAAVVSLLLCILLIKVELILPHLTQSFMNINARLHRL